MGLTCWSVLLAVNLAALVAASPFRSKYDVNVARELLERLKELSVKSLLFDKETLADCTNDDASYCVTEWPVDYCEKYSNVPDECPAMCGTCKKKLPESSSDTCPGYDNSYCGDPLHPADCTATSFVPNACPAMCGLCKAKPPVCTKDDEFKCGGTYRVDQCRTDSVAKACPAMCGLCMKKLPASPSDECPEYDNGYCGTELSSADCTESTFATLACPAMCGRCKQKPVPTLDDCTKDDTSDCNHIWLVDECTEDSGMRERCPAACGLCKKKLPEQPTDDCPEYDNWYCGEVWLPSDCNRRRSVPSACPGMCGLCKRKARSNKDGNDTPGDVVVEPPACDARYKALDDHTICHTPSSLLTPGNNVVYDGQKWLIVELHNKLRAKPYPQDPTMFGSDMQTMVWDDNIAKVAQTHANTCIMEHDHDNSVVGYTYGIGQNLGAGSISWESCIEKGWYGEVKDFIYGEDSKKGWEAIGHYTAVVQAYTARIGCGFANCNYGDKPGTWSFYVCNYGKIQGDLKKPFAAGEQCGQCPHTCNAGLCDCKGMICENGGDLDLDTCTCKCKDLWNGSPRCTVVSCPDQDYGYCGNSGWKHSDCRSDYIRNACPYMCGLCNMPTPSSPSDDCPKQDSSYCGGRVLQSDCATYARSACPGMCGLCKKLPPDCTIDDASKCLDGWTVDQCSDADVASACPAMCGLCMKKLPKLVTDTCPDYGNWYCAGKLTQLDCVPNSYVPKACPAMCGLCTLKPPPVLPDCIQDDWAYCVSYPRDTCKPDYFLPIRNDCPAMCSLCKKKLPVWPTTVCPEKDNPYCGGAWVEQDCKLFYVRDACPGMCHICQLES